MFESLPKLSLTTREAVGREADNFSKLSESGAEIQVDQEIAKLGEINQWAAGGVEAVAYCFRQLDDMLHHDNDTPEEVKAFWGTFGPYLKVRVLEATLILLQAIDRELWAESMESKMKAGEVSQQ